MKKYCQNENGYKFTEDSILLKNFALEYDMRNFVDLGSGCGIVAIEILRERNDIEGTAVEIQKNLALTILENIRQFSVKNLTVINSDMVEWSYRCKETYDMAIINPPYCKIGEGKESKNEENYIAKHEVKINLIHIFFVVEKVLNSDGYFLMIFPVKRLFELQQIASKNNFFIHRLRFINKTKNIKLVLVALSRKKSNDLICECIK